MIEAERLGTRVMAWSHAEQWEIFRHILALESALRKLVTMIENSAYAPHMREDIAGWHALLEALPPDKPTQT